MPTTVASRDLRNHTADVLRRVGEGERVIITVRGEAVAEVVPVRRARPDFFHRDELVAILSRAGQDPTFAEDVRALSEGSTDDLGPLW